MRNLTGKFRIRKTFFGWKIKVEYWKGAGFFPYDDGPNIKIWGNARIEDLIELGINCT